MKNSTSFAERFGIFFLQAAVVMVIALLATSSPAVVRVKTALPEEPEWADAPDGGRLMEMIEMKVARAGHTATLLQDGRVLLAGGENEYGLVGEAEIFDPASLEFHLAGKSRAVRSDHTAALLADGRVLLAGGRDYSGLVNSTEIFDPYSSKFAAGPSMRLERAGHSGTVLADGRYLVVGGDAEGSAEVFDPAAQRFVQLEARMKEARAAHSAALLADGRVLIAGGLSPDGEPLDTAVIFDPETMSFSDAFNAMKAARVQPVLKALFDGKVQVIGGDDEGTMEMFNPERARFSALVHLVTDGGSMEKALRSPARAALLRADEGEGRFRAEFAGLEPEAVEALMEATERTGHTLTEIPQYGMALVAGGTKSGVKSLRSGAVFSAGDATVSTDKIDYMPGEIVTITGTGFFPGEMVELVLKENPKPEGLEDLKLYPVADENGAFVNKEFSPEERHRGVSFLLIATGLTSGKTASTTFTDDNVVNDVVVGENDTFTLGGSTTVSYKIVATGGDGQTGCNASDGSAATVTINTPAGVTATPGSLTFTTCGDYKAVMFTASAAGNYPITVSVSDSGSGSYHTTPAAFTLTVTGKQNQTITVTTAAPGSATYGTSFLVAATGGGSNNDVVITASGGCSGGGNNSATITMTSGTTTCSVQYNQAGNDDYNAAPQVSSDTVAVKTDASCSISGYSGVYDAAYHGASGSCTGVGGVNLSAGLDLGATFKDVPGGTANWAFTGNGNYNDQSGSAAITITKADATCSISGYTGVYDGVAHGATGSCTGVLGENLSGLSLGASFTDVPGGTANWTFTGGTNYNNQSGDVAITINPKAVTVTAAAKTKVMGEADPALTYTFSPALIGTDAFTGALSRVAGESVGTYPIQQGTLALSSNYILNFVAANLTILYATAGTVCLGQPASTILQPISSEILSVFKKGSTVPAKFRVCDANGNSIGTPGVVSNFVQVASSSIDAMIENTTVDSTTPDTTFRWSASDQQWIFNMSTKGLSANKAYYFRISLNDGTSIGFGFGLK